LTFYGIEGEDFSHGVGLSLDVEKAAHEVVKQVAKEVHPPISIVSLDSKTAG
jgi:hypothetical protein